LKYVFILLGQDVISKHFVKYPEFWHPDNFKKLYLYNDVETEGRVI